jgi:hypothetical protein
MKCANPLCNAKGLYLRSGSLHVIDTIVGGEGQVIQRKIVWLCETCTRLLEVETWRPPGQQLQPRSKSPYLQHSAPTTH